VPFDAAHDETAEVVGAGTTDIIHDQSIFFSEMRLSGRYGISDALSVELMLPVRYIDVGIVYRDQATRQPVELADPDIHHRNETLTGLVDPWLVGGYWWKRDSLRLTFKLGTTLPLGHTEEDPFALGDMDLEHQHLQFGTGIFAPVVGVDARYDFPSWTLFGYGLTVQHLYESGKNYQPGDRYITGVDALSRFGTEKWTFRVGTAFQAETAERWGGVRRTDEGNQGRVDLLASAGLIWQFSERFAATADVQVPVYNRVTGGQLDYPAITQLGIVARFDIAGGHDHGHDHEHGHDHDEEGHEDEHEHEDEHGHDDGHEHGAETRLPAMWDGVDMVELTQTGEAVALEPVAGKVTVFDFWATWCEPCKKLDPLLADLARRYPGKLAIRKINVIDWDSAATAKYLNPGGFNLPHIKVYGTLGKRVFEKSSDPKEMADMVEKLLIDSP